jgi:hypothetical protein
MKLFYYANLWAVVLLSIGISGNCIAQDTPNDNPLAGQKKRDKSDKTAAHLSPLEKSVTISAIADNGTVNKLVLGNNLTGIGKDQYGVYLTNGKSQLLFARPSDQLTSEWWAIGNLHTEDAAIFGDSTEIRFKCGGGGNAPFWIFPHRIRIAADSLSYANGTQGEGKVLTSDAAGNANWKSFSGWTTSGNKSVDPTNSFIGTIDSDTLKFKVKGIPAGLVSIAQYNTSFGADAMANLEVSNFAEGNSAFGGWAMHNLGETGKFNTGIGCRALMSVTDGSFNTAVGVNALNTLSHANYNTAIGYDAGVERGAQNAIAIGRGAFAKSGRCAFSPFITAIVPGDHLTTDLGRDIKRYDSLFINHIAASGNISTLGKISASNLNSGTYVPSLVNVDNIAETQAFACQYMRIGNTVTVSGKIQMKCKSAGSFKVGISLPVPSDFTAEEDCAGVGSTVAVNEPAQWILANVEKDRVSLRGSSMDAQSHVHYFTFTYTIKGVVSTLPGRF